MISAVIGALSTQIFALCKEWYSQKLQQLRAINGAIIASASICDGLLQVESQHLGRVKMLLDDENERLDNALEQHHLNGDSLIFESEITFLTVTKIDLPVNQLADLLHSKVNANSSDLLYFYSISQSYQILLNSLNRYNELVIELSEKYHNADAEEVIFRVTGRTMRDGTVDSRYSDCIDQLLAAIRSGAAFSALLCESLEKRGKKLSNSFIYRKPKVCRVDFPAYKKKGIFPSKSQLDKYRIDEVSS